MLTIRTLLLVLVALLVLAGCKSSDTTANQMSARADAAYKQYKTADYANAKAALLDYIGFLDRTAASDPKLTNLCNADAMTSYVRLVKLERKNQGSDEARYMSEAISRCGKLEVKGHNCSADALRASTDKMDALPAK